MIGFIKGEVKILDKDAVVVENNGIGYRINFSKIANIKLNTRYTFYTYMQVREDDISLYGFLEKQEYDLFIKLISVKGLGPKIANNIIGYKSYDEIIKAIENEELTMIKTFPGVGAKTASQIILDLKGKLISQEKQLENPIILNVTTALKNLGFKANEIASTIQGIEVGSLNQQELLKLCLSTLSKKR